ncbi:hypothetical protein AMAG_12068 [Allomyces macrogynus ATCC 38327]|uniref:Alpha-tubulin N-acetyltransferase n=1 Tax=Allomyces macrogynus (strain ATCC 38327) TaxID=578462 RepID=A0A0L0SZ76_ALLM3|nr:hypothetical protein AMAG_12068 [Allomyces macrogynus ATCC 38327]|eukprot:KNE67614.1 hypothetical protein AMAG_12068 [Allomyces macrogynus ATCC 38327]
MDVPNDLVASFFAEGAVSVVQASAFRPPALCTVQQRQRQEQFGMVLDALGAASAKAQCLKTPITSIKRLLDTDHRIYMLRVPSTASDEPDGSASPGGKPFTWTVVGFLKVASKKLYLNDGTGQLKAVTPLCVLDFYVVEGRQRQGHGKTLFEAMLEREDASPEDLAYDRPSPRMRAFLAKNYGLVEAHAQPNNYVLFRFGAMDTAAPRRPPAAALDPLPVRHARRAAPPPPAPPSFPTFPVHAAPAQGLPREPRARAAPAPTEIVVLSHHHHLHRPSPGSSGPTSPKPSAADLVVPRSTPHSLESVVAQVNRLPALPGARHHQAASVVESATAAGARRTRPSALARSTPILPHLAASSPWTTVGLTTRR